MKKSSRQPTHLQRNAEARTKSVWTSLEKAMRRIEIELQEHEGIYPYNGGRLSQAELVRRAGLGESTLQGKLHRKTTLPKVNTWLVGVKATAIVGAVAVRKTVTSRADDLKNALTQMGTNYLVRELTINELQGRIRVLEKENAVLKSQIEEASAGKVGPLRR